MHRFCSRKCRADKCENGSLSFCSESKIRLWSFPSSEANFCVAKKDANAGDMLFTDGVVTFSHDPQELYEKLFGGMDESNMPFRRVVDMLASALKGVDQSRRDVVRKYGRCVSEGIDGPQGSHMFSFSMTAYLLNALASATSESVDNPNAQLVCYQYESRMVMSVVAIQPIKTNDVIVVGVAPRLGPLHVFNAVVPMLLKGNIPLFKLWINSVYESLVRQSQCSMYANHAQDVIDLFFQDSPTLISLVILHKSLELGYWDGKSIPQMV